MSKTDKELAVEITKSFIESRPTNIVVSPNSDVPYKTNGVGVSDIQTVLKSIHKTIKELPD